MENSLFNSPFEMALRALLLLSAAPENCFSADRIVALDFITCYASDFELPYSNLHGKNNFKYGEISSRRLLVQEALKDLVIRGLFSVAIDRGYLFSISEKGAQQAKIFKSRYAEDYLEIAKNALEKYQDHSDEEIIALIQTRSLQSLEEKRDVLH